jgi:microcystin-dependent protein
MPYTVNFTDSGNKTPITVFDNTSSTDTSLVFPGRNVTGYGQIIAENFLHLLENFASDTQPVNPVEGQLWYDTLNSSLKLYDNVTWTAASGIQKGPSEPPVAASKVGELWVDTTNQQLRIYTGQRWLLVGPNQSTVDGLRYGPSVEEISDSDNIDRYILLFYIADIPVIIFSKDSFTPKVKILGFPYLRSGLNVATDKDLQGNIDPQVAPLFAGGFLPVVFGTARNADALNIGGIEVEAGKFLRSNTTNTTDFGFNIRNNSGLTLGIDGTFNISTSATAAKIYNSASGSSIDVQTNRNGIPTTILRVIDNKVSINKSSPDFELDIDGSIQATGSLIITNTTVSTNLNNGSIKTAGGMSITKNLIVGDGIDVSSTLQTNNVQPSVTDIFDVGTTSKRYRTVRAKTVVADTIEGVLSGNISGRSNTALALDNITTFQLAGDVISGPVQFDGQTGSYTKTFNTVLTANIIAGRTEPFPNVSKKSDLVLTYRASESSSASSGLLKQTRDTFVGDFGVPMGAVMPYAGSNAPYGYLFCDGSEVEITKYPDLYDVISTIYNGIAPLQGVNTFRIPDLRGRFALGRDNMDNAALVPLISGGFVDAGGGAAGRVPDVLAQTLGGGAGQASVGLVLANLPEHSHTLSSTTQDYAAIAVTTTLDANATTGLGPTAPGQAQYLRDSGGIKKGTGVTLGTPIGLMNPYQTLNYIIRSGPPAF